MKYFSEAQVSDLIKLKWGQLVDDASGPTLTSDAALAKVFKVSGSTVRRLYTARFEELRRKQLPFVERLRLPHKESGRQRWGLRFLKEHEVQWLVSSGTLRQQVGLSLAARSQHFL